MHICNSNIIIPYIQQDFAKLKNSEKKRVEFRFLPGFLNLIKVLYKAYSTKIQEVGIVAEGTIGIRGLLYHGHII